MCVSPLLYFWCFMLLYIFCYTYPHLNSWPRNLGCKKTAHQNSISPQLWFFFSPFVLNFPDDDDDGKATTQPLLKKGRRSTLLGCLKMFSLCFVFVFLHLFLLSLVCYFSPLKSYFPFLLLSLSITSFFTVFWILLVLTYHPAPCCLCLVSLPVCPVFLAPWLLVFRA